MAFRASPSETDTIVAISTPPGRGGIGIVRLSGPHAQTIAQSLLQLTAPLEHTRARLTRVPDPSDLNLSIDEALVTAFHAPHSYTGEDLVEIAAHGSPVVLNTLVEAALHLGARLAAPGEFTQRGFLCGRLDLTQAEAVADLIAAHTLEQARAAAQQLGGALSHRVAEPKGSLLHLIALLEAGMDFAAGELDDVAVVPAAQVASEIAATRAPLEALAASFRHGALLRSGVSLALVGPPNAGKSSLFNRLLERDRAIVTPLPGTTRDTIEESLALNGIPLRLIDTAGLRAPSDPDAPDPSHPETGERIDEAEQQGIARSREALADADLILLIHDATQPLAPDERDLAASLTHRPHLCVHNKIDLLAEAPAPDASGRTIYTSALTGAGIDTLRAAILRELQAEGSLAATGALNNLRQRQAVTSALDALSAAAHANASGLPHELILIDLHHALTALDSLTGITTPDDILARIFATFCIGK